MSRLIAPPKQGTAALLLVFVASVAMVLLTPSAAVGGIPLGVSADYSSHCEPGGDEDNIDPVGVLFRGTQASAKKAAFETERLAGWTYEGLGDQRLKVKLSAGNYGCRNVSVQPASEPDFRKGPPPSIPQTRYHVRLWFIPASQNAEERKTVGTPHREDFIEHDPTGLSDHCKGLFSIPWGFLDLAPGSHAVKKGGTKTEEDSGFDQGRQELRLAFERSRHNVASEKWGNDELIEQCDEDMAGSNGNGIVIGLNWVKSGRTDRPAARQSSALLLGRLETDEKSTDWWFEYGPSSSEGASTYPKKTSVQSVAEASEADVSQAIAGLSPNSTYYVRMFVRDKEGEVEEGNEVKFETCGRENADENDRSKGPRAATPECGGVVDTFYRDVNGDLGHQSWSPEGDWSTATQPASIARSANPQVVPRSDGSRVIDVFYKDTGGDLGHHRYTPGSGWEMETRSVAMASDPNVVTRANGTIDVFYRTTGGELGHEWWVPGSGWSSEIRPTILSSDPHAVVHEDGSIDVLYRIGSSLGRDNWTSKSGWAHEVKSGSLVAEPRPIARKSGALDVFYRTAENKLGYDWFVPGSGWSRETRSVSLASDPHVVSRPNGTIDVFYRTSGDELGHDWWVSGSGWSTETRPGNLSSDPHVVARADGSVEVFYRDGNRIGRQSYVSGPGWSVELRPGPIAWHTDPHVVTQSDGRIDVVYETPTGQLGRDWYVPGAGWSHEIRPAKQSRRPVAAYSFDAGAGEVAEDTAGGHDGTIEGPEWFNHGKFGAALSFDGEVGEQVMIPDSNDLDLSDELTLEAWVRPTEAIEWSAIVTKVRGAGISYQLLAHADHNAPVGYLANAEKEWGVDGGTTPLPANTWSHIAFTSDGARLRFYVDGKLKGSDNMLAAAAASTGPLVIGGDTFKGRIDEVRVYDRALDEGELATDKVMPIQTPARPPVAAYSFEAGEGELAEDVAGGHDGTIEGAEWFDKGKFGSALYFDGTTDLVTIPDSNDLDLTDEFTLEAWVRPAETNEWSAVITKERGEGAVSYQMHAEGEDSAPVGYVGNSKGEFGVDGGTTALPVHAWSHLVLTYDGAELRYYVNGELEGTNSSGDPGVSADPLLIGGDISWGEEDAFKGLIDEVRVYDRALDAGEIATDKVTPIQTPARPPVADYSFDAGEGTLAEDSAGGHDGTIEGAEWVRGKFGSALRFNEEDCVSVSAISDLQFVEDQEFTLEAWVRPTGDGYADPVISMEDEGAAEGEEAFSYMLLAGGEEATKAWVRKGGEAGFQGVYGTEWLPENAWSHIAVTYDGAKLRLYVDGILDRTEPGQTVSSASGPLTIGCGWFKGLIDEVRVYDRALDAGEIATDKVTPIQTPARPPVADYSFDAGEGTLAEDSAGGHDGTIEGAEWVRGKFGSALRFNEEDCVSVSAISDLQFVEDQEFTLEAWVRPTGDGYADPVISMEDEGAAEGEEAFSYMLLAGGEEATKAWVRKGGEAGFQGVYGTEWLPENAWSHIAVTYDGAKLRLYVDGILDRTEPGQTVSSASGPLTIGCGWFKGLIDEVRVYDRALDAGEIATDKVTPIQTPARPPVADYSFDAGEGTLAEDSAGGHDGTIEGAEWVRGKFGSALRFNEEDCVSVSAISDLQFVEDQEFTLEAWVRPTGDGYADPVISMEDEGAAEGEEAFSYMLLAGGEEATKAWVRKGGEAGFQGVYGTEWLPENAWSHIAVTYDGAKLRLYVDGILDRTEPGQTVSSASGPLTIGCGWFKGLIDEVRVYDRALDAGELTDDED